MPESPASIPRRPAGRLVLPAPAVNPAPRSPDPAAAPHRLRLLSYNIQAGIHSRHYRDYLANGWKHILPHAARLRNLAQIGAQLHGYDLVGLQEVDAGSLRSAHIDQTEYLAHQAGYSYWFAQINRRLGTLARHSNGLLSQLQPAAIIEHRLPGLPGRGALVAEFPTSSGDSLAVCVLHLALGWRARRRQLEYLVAVAHQYPFVVLMGDFNCGCGSRTLRMAVAASGLRGLDCGLKTFPSWRPAENLDHILVSPSLRITEAGVVPYALSDHLPIRMLVELPAGVAISR
ncbi:MAG: endonuclease [Chromatiaceae bacterium]|nr:MAG: endonuclease [Chromatiaceae bacterium]